MASSCHPTAATPLAVTFQGKIATSACGAASGPLRTRGFLQAELTARAAARVPKLWHLLKSVASHLPFLQT